MTRNSAIPSVLLVLGIAACGANLERRMTQACVKDGDMSEKRCQCVADRASKDLSKNAQELLVAELEKDQERAAELGKQLSLAEAAQVGTFMMNAMSQCALGNEVE